MQKNSRFHDFSHFHHSFPFVISIKNPFSSGCSVLSIRKLAAGLRRGILLLCILAGGFCYARTESREAEAVWTEAGAGTETGNRTGFAAGDIAKAETKTRTESVTETVFESKTETGAAARSGETETSAPQGARGRPLVNLNTATGEELESLPGIGPATAKLILEYRRDYGGFAAPEELMNVRRIGEKTFEKLKPYICVGDPASSDS